MFVAPLVLLAVRAGASPFVAGESGLLERGLPYPSCSAVSLRVIDFALTIVRPQASYFCSSFLGVTTSTLKSKVPHALQYLAR